MFLSIFTEMHVPVVICEGVWVQRDAGGLGDAGSVLGGCSGEGRSPTAAFLCHGIFQTISLVIGKKKGDRPCWRKPEYRLQGHVGFSSAVSSGKVPKALPRVVG